MQYNEELVSIIIPTYKRNNKIERAINSAINQTYKNVEIIVVDDNYPESEWRTKTENVMQKYRDSCNIRYIKHKKNCGAGIARNTGISAARGDYISFLDDDDWYEEKKIELQMKALQLLSTERIGIIYCDMRGIDEHEKTVWLKTIEYNGLPFVESVTNDCISPTSTWLCPQKALRQLRGFMSIPAKQDVLLMAQLIAEGYKIYRVPQILVNYSCHSDEKISENLNSKIIGIQYIRNFARTRYSTLGESDIKKVESKNAIKLFNLYATNGNYSGVKEEFKNILRYSKLKQTIKYTIKKLFLFGRLKWEIAR